METGKRVSRLEKQVIDKYRETVFVSYQLNGYKDTRTELRILRNSFKPEITKRAGGTDAEFLLVQDQLKVHKCAAALTYVLCFICFCFCTHCLGASRLSVPLIA